jgi:hypothetical protein
MKLLEIIKRNIKEYLIEGKESLDLYDIARWGLEGEYEHSGCWDDVEDLEEAITCAVESFKHFLSKPYPVELGDIPGNPIIYRLVRLKDVNDLNRKILGKSWFSNPDQINKQGFFDMLDYLKPFKTEEGVVYMIKGRIRKDNIDMKRTLWERDTQWLENEIVLVDDLDVEILSVKPLSKLDYEN